MTETRQILRTIRKYQGGFLPNLSRILSFVPIDVVNINLI